MAVEATEAHISLAHFYGHIDHKHCRCPNIVTFSSDAFYMLDNVGGEVSGSVAGDMTDDMHLTRGRWCGI